MPSKVAPVILPADHYALLSTAVAGSDKITPLQTYPGQDFANNLDYPTSTQPHAMNNYTRQFSAGAWGTEAP